MQKQSYFVFPLTFSSRLSHSFSLTSLASPASPASLTSSLLPRPPGINISPGCGGRAEITKEVENCWKFYGTLSGSKNTMENYWIGLSSLEIAYFVYNVSILDRLEAECVCDLILCYLFLHRHCISNIFHE